MMTTTHAARAVAWARRWALSWPTTFLDQRGAPVVLRPVTADDADEIRRLHDRCSPDTLRWRYFSTAPQVEHVLTWVFDELRGTTMAAVADGRIVGLGHLVRTARPEVGEVAFLVEDAWQGRGIGSALVDRVVGLARRAELDELHADVAIDNDRMRHILGSRGWAVRLEHGTYALDLDLALPVRASAS